MLVWIEKTPYQKDLLVLWEKSRYPYVNVEIWNLGRFGNSDFSLISSLCMSAIYICKWILYLAQRFPNFVALPIKGGMIDREHSRSKMKWHMLWIELKKLLLEFYLWVKKKHSKNEWLTWVYFKAHSFSKIGSSYR